MKRRMQGCCIDCGRKYGDEYGFPDLIVPDEAWKAISPTGDEGGLLCPSCMCRRVHDAGVRCEARFTSGPFCGRGEPFVRILFRPLLTSAFIGSRRDVGVYMLIDSEQPESEQAVALWHEALHLLGLKNEDQIEALARRLANACPEILPAVKAANPTKEVKP